MSLGDQISLSLHLMADALYVNENVCYFLNEKREFERGYKAITLLTVLNILQHPMHILRVIVYFALVAVY